MTSADEWPMSAEVFFKTVEAGAYDAHLELEFPNLLHPVYGTPRHQSSWIHFELEAAVSGLSVYEELVAVQAAKKPGEEFEVRKYEIKPCEPDDCPRTW